MHLYYLFSLFIILISLTNQILCQDSSYETCHVWGDPHLLMFPMHPSQADTRAIYWCRSPGRMLILKNKYIEVSVIVTDKPFYNENYEIKLFAGSTTLCTITHQDPSCQNIFVQTQQMGDTLSIDYYDADLLNIIVTSHSIQNSVSYNIMITQSYPLILQSSGLCVTKQPTCQLENVLKSVKRRDERNLNHSSAAFICDKYMTEAYKTAEYVMGNKGSKMTEHARAACIDDVTLSGDASWGQSTIPFIVMDALKQAQLNTAQRLLRLRIAAPQMIKAAALARNATPDCLECNSMEAPLHISSMIH